MKRAALFFALVACGGGDTPPASPPPNYAAQARAQQAQQMADTQRMMQEQQTRNQVAVEQARTQQQQAMADSIAQSNARMAAAQQAANDRAAAADADRAKALEASCVSSRSRRASEAQGIAKSWAAFIKRATPQVKRIQSICKIKDTTGVRVEHDTDTRGTTYRVRNVGAYDDVVCSSALPAGISKSDAHDVLMLDQYLTTAITEDSQDSSLNKQCEASDQAVGLRTRATFGDGEAIKSLLQWGRDGGAP